MPARPGVQTHALYLRNPKGLHPAFLNDVLQETLHRPVRICDWRRTRKTRVVKLPSGYDPEEELILHEIAVSYIET